MNQKPIALPLEGYDDRDAYRIKEGRSSGLQNVRTLRDRVQRGPGATQFTPAPTALGSGKTGFGIATGQFSAPAITEIQVIPHNLGSTPVAMILWSSGKIISDFPDQGVNWSVGFSDLNGSRCAGMYSVPQVATSSSRRIWTDKAMTILGPVAAVQDQATLVSWNSTSFTLSWVATFAPQFLIGYTLFGGDGISGKVVGWTLTPGAGNVSVTGVGFKPQAVLHLSADIGTINTTGAGAKFAYGAMALDPSASRWFQTFSNQDAVGPSQSRKAHNTNRTIAQCDFNAATFTWSVDGVTFDADGFTVSKNTPPAGNTLMASLCLAGYANCDIGSYTKSTAAGPVISSPAPTFGQPTAYLFSSAFAVAGAGATVNIDNGLGTATTGRGQQSIWYGEQDGAAVTNPAALNSEQESLESAGSNPPSLAAVTDAATWRVNYPGGNFILEWNPNDSTADIIYWLALLYSIGPGSNIGTPRNLLQPQLGQLGGPTVDTEIMLTHQSMFIYDTGTTMVATSEVYTGTAVQRFGWAVTQGIVAFSNGKDYLRQYDGFTAGPLISQGVQHGCKWVLAFANRFISVRCFFGLGDHPTQIRWCADGLLHDWSATGAGFLEIQDTSSDPITGAFVMGERAYLTKRSEMIELVWTNTLNPVFFQESRFRGKGFTAGYSITVGDNFAIGFGPDNIYLWDGARMNPVGDPIYHSIIPNLDPSQIDQLQGAIHQTDGEYWLMVGQTIYIYDYIRDRWFVDMPASGTESAIGILNVGGVAAPSLDPNASETVLIAQSTGLIYREDYTATAFLGAAVTSYVDTCDYVSMTVKGTGLSKGTAVESYTHVNECWGVWFRTDPAVQVQVYTSTDRGTSFVLQQTVTSDGRGMAHASMQVPFQQIRFRFENTGTGSFTIYEGGIFEWEDIGTNLA